MKRLLVVLLSLIYLAASSGFTLRQHYCMGQLIGTAIHYATPPGDTHRCGRCGMEKKSDDNGCCKDQVKTFKASPDQLPVKSLQAPAMIAVVPLQIFWAMAGTPDLPNRSTVTSAPAHGPPGKGGALPIYLQVRCLRL